MNSDYSKGRKILRINYLFKKYLLKDERLGILLNNANKGLNEQE